MKSDYLIWTWQFKTVCVWRRPRRAIRCCWTRPRQPHTESALAITSGSDELFWRVSTAAAYSVCAYFKCRSLQPARPSAGRLLSAPPPFAHPPAETWRSDRRATPQQHRWGYAAQLAFALERTRAPSIQGDRHNSATILYGFTVRPGTRVALVTHRDARKSNVTVIDKRGPGPLSNGQNFINLYKMINHITHRDRSYRNNIDVWIILKMTELISFFLNGQYFGKPIYNPKEPVISFVGLITQSNPAISRGGSTVRKQWTRPFGGGRDTELTVYILQHNYSKVKANNIRHIAQTRPAPKALHILIIYSYTA